MSQFHIEYIKGLYLFSFNIHSTFLKCLQVLQCLSSRSSKFSRGDTQANQEMLYKGVGAQRQEVGKQKEAFQCVNIDQETF